MKFDNQIKEQIINEKAFLEEAKALLKELVNNELEKNDNEIDFDFINECTEVLLFIEDEDTENVILTLTSKKILSKATGISLRKTTPYARALIAVAVIMASTFSAFAVNRDINPVEAISKLVSSISENQEDMVEKKTTTDKETTTAPAETTVKTTPSTTKATTKKAEVVITEKNTSKKAEVTTRKVAQSTTTLETNNGSRETTEPTTHKVNMDTAEYMELCFDKWVKKTYHIGEYINCTGMEVKIHYTDDYIVKMPVKYCTITGFDTSKVGDCTVTISYKNVSQSFTVTVIE